MLSFWLHLASSTRRMNEEAACTTAGNPDDDGHAYRPRVLVRKLQNWQSEFLSIAVLIVLGIFLRERGSPESKPVAAPHASTGH